jgi:hypothetical protein
MMPIHDSERLRFSYRSMSLINGHLRLGITSCIRVGNEDAADWLPRRRGCAPLRVQFVV